MDWATKHLAWQSPRRPRAMLPAFIWRCDDGYSHWTWLSYDAATWAAWLEVA